MTVASVQSPSEMRAWAHDINQLLHSNRVPAVLSAAPTLGVAEPEAVYADAGMLWRRAATPTFEPASERESWHFSAATAETLARSGLQPGLMEDLARISQLPVADLQRFAGVDRTTVKRRADKGLALPEDVAVKLLTVAHLVGQATQVFGSVESAAAWLNTPHPLLDDDSPLQRARTPWGLDKVRGLLVALRYGGAA